MKKKISNIFLKVKTSILILSSFHRYWLDFLGTHIFSTLSFLKVFCRNLIGCSENIYHNKLKHFVSTTLMIMFLKRKLNTEEWAWKSEEKNIFEKNFWRSFCIMIVIFSTRLAWELFLTNSYLKKKSKQNMRLIFCKEMKLWVIFLVIYFEIFCPCRVERWIF